MEKNRILLILPVLFIVLGIVFSSTTSAEIIIINESKPSFYSVEDITLKGDLETNKLTVTGSGVVITGEKVKVYLLGRASDILVDNLKVNGRPVPVSFDGNGYFMVVDEGQFALQGDLYLRTAGQVRIYVPGPVNNLKFDLQHGYAIHGDQYGLKDDEVIIQRSEKVAMLVDGSFKYTYAERNSFYYQLDYKSFGSSLGQAAINLKNGESIVSVVGAKDYSVNDGKLLLELEGDRANVVVSGTFQTGQIAVPLDEGRHHVLIESDPQKKLTITTDAEEIDLTQSTLPPSYSNARAFLASKDNQFTVAVNDLQMFPSLAASVSRSVNRIAVTEKGSMLGELTYQYSNTGMDYVGIDVNATPLYAATGYRNSVKLTKDGGKLFLSFPKAQGGTLDVIYFATRDPLKPVDLIDVPVANTDLTITEAETQVILPKDYVILWTFGAEGGSELPTVETSLIFLMIFGGLGYLMKKDRMFAIMYLVFSVGLFYFSSLLLVLSVIVSIVLILKRHIAGNSVKFMLAGAAALIVLCLMAVAFFWTLGIFNMGGTTYARNAMVQSDYAAVEEAALPSAMSKSMNVIGGGEGAINVPVREGVLPVRLELPALGKSITVTSHLVHKDDPLKISVLVVAGWFRYLLYLISLFCGLSCIRRYGKRA